MSKQKSKVSESLAAYQDVKFVLDIAIEKSGLQYVCETAGAATHFKQRCNKYRNLLRGMQDELTSFIPGQRPESAYDILSIRQVGADLNSARDGCIILFEHRKLKGKLIDPETGEEISLPNSLITGVINDDL